MSAIHIESVEKNLSILENEEIVDGLVHRNISDYNQFFRRRKYSDNAKQRFLKQYFTKLNLEFYPRYFDAFSQISFGHLSPGDVDTYVEGLTNIFFDKKINLGLKDDFIRNKTIATKIQFDTELASNKQMKDKRIQIHFKSSSEVFTRVCILLEQQGIYNNNVQVIKHVCLIIGGDTMLIHVTVI